MEVTRWRAGRAGIAGRGVTTFAQQLIIDVLPQNEHGYVAAEYRIQVIFRIELGASIIRGCVS